jgi:hypothetical protein
MKGEGLNGIQAGGEAKRNPCKLGKRECKPRQGDRYYVVPSALLYLLHS